MIELYTIKELSMGLWNLSIVAPLQRAKNNTTTAVENQRQIVRSRFDDEKILTQSLITVCEEIISHRIIMKVTKDLEFRGGVFTGTEQRWDSAEKNTVIYKREIENENVMLYRVETTLNINSRMLNISAEFYNEGGAIIQQYPDGFAHGGIAFAVTDESTKRAIKRRLLSKLSMISAQHTLL